MTTPTPTPTPEDEDEVGELSCCPWCGAQGPDFDEAEAPSNYCDHSTD